MLFVKQDGTEAQVQSIKRQCRVPRGPREHRILRDRVLLLLRHAGMTDQDLAEVGEAFYREPITTRSTVHRRLDGAAASACGEAKGRGLLDAD